MQLSHPHPRSLEELSPRQVADLLNAHEMDRVRRIAPLNEAAREDRLGRAEEIGPGAHEGLVALVAERQLSGYPGPGDAGSGGTAVVRGS